MSLAVSLTLLAGDPFAAAFGHSTNLKDYCWGKLHRLVLAHPLVGPFDIPGARGTWPAPLSGLAGIPVDGGFSTLDVGNPESAARADSVDGFMFEHRPPHRLISSTRPSGMHATLR